MSIPVKQTFIDALEASGWTVIHVSAWQKRIQFKSKKIVTELYLEWNPVHKTWTLHEIKDT